jgi:hypothetical protein
MWQAWRSLASARGVSAAVDTGRFGILVWDSDATVPLQFDLARYTGRWGAGAARSSRPGPRI